MERPPVEEEEEGEYCTCSAMSNNHDEHVPTCPLYTPLSSIDFPGWPRRSSTASGSVGRGSSSGTRPPSYSGGGYGMGIFSGSNLYHYPPPSNVSSIAASYASTSSVFDSMAATETESLSSYPMKRSISISSFSSTTSSFQHLPTELWRQIFSSLAVDDLKAVVSVSRQWRSAGNPMLWRTMTFPLDKRRLAAMKPALSHFGHLVRKVIITPPIIDSQVGGGRSSRRVSTSNSRSWSLSRPISRSGSHHQQQQQMQHPGARNGSEGLAENSTIVSSAATASIPGTIHSGFASGASSPRQQPQSPSSHMPPPSPMSLASTSRQRPSSSITTPQPDFSVSATPSTGGGGGGGSGRRLSRASVSTLPSPMLPPVYAVPIPGTPGPGNVISESVPHSASGSSLGAGFGVAGMANGGSTTSRIGSHSNQHSSTTHSYQHHEISEGTVTRMHQFMERYCNGVLEAVVKNPTGISSHSRRLGILVRLFQAYPRLERLELSDFIMWDTQPLQLVSEQLHMLKSLDVTNRVELSDNDLLPVVEHCPRLRVLRIRATNATDVTIHAIINNLSHSLVSLNVGGCPVSSAAMSELVARCTKLRVLQMWSCLRLDDNFLLSLDPLVLGCLQVLDMMDVQKFSIEAVKRTFGRQSWPYLKYLRIRAKCDRDDFSGIPATAVLKLNSTTILD
ncbi:hypothetical protein GGI23_003591 [Coemansia sp. RSA 2559]|nr:hypothetical protein GGI23_003591 [Coemansia sp. RSA 2559]